MKLAGSVAIAAAAVFGLTAAQSSVASAASGYASGSYASGAPSQSTGLPQVDLGYEIHQALAYNSTGQYYNFSNIRFAQPPVGDLRFAHPVPPNGRNPVVQNGSQEFICPQAAPVWQLIAIQFQEAYTNGSVDSFNYTRARDIAMAQLLAAQARPSTPDPRVSEDCLFLDVMAPASAFNNRNRTQYRNTTGAPVLVWIYGGGYTQGYKTQAYNPSGIIATSMRGAGTNTTEPVIFVAMNYRLGALGWLSGPGFQFEGGISNAALYDQRLAIQWVREKIHLFGGDPDRITIFGESAGGGSIMHQITAYAGYRGINFQKAIVQSPGWAPISSQYIQETTAQAFYKALNVSSLAEARRANTSAVILANSRQIAASPYGSYTYGPAVDGIFVPAQPGISLGSGAFAKNISIMAGHNSHEGVFFTPPYISTEADVRTWATNLNPQAPSAVIDYITTVLYPPIYDGSQNYTSAVTRVIKIVSELIFTCNTNYLARAYNNNTYNYEFQIPPGVHGQDIAYTFWYGQAGSVTVPRVARELQGYITGFAATGNPNAPDLPPFPMQGSTARMVGLNISATTIQTDPTVNNRCLYLQKYLYT